MEKGSAYIELAPGGFAQKSEAGTTLVYFR